MSLATTENGIKKTGSGQQLRAGVAALHSVDPETLGSFQLHYYAIPKELPCPH